MKQKQLLLIGSTVVLALLLVIGTLLFLNPTPGDGKTIVHVQFQNIEKITKGTLVTFSGHPVGTVSAVHMLPMETRSNTCQYPYELVLKIDSSIKLFTHDLITIRTAGLMGERSIAIIPVYTDNTVLADSGYVFTGKSVESLEEAVASASQVLNKIDTLVTSLNEDQFSARMTTLAMTGTDCLKKYDAIADSVLKGPNTINHLLTTTTLGTNMDAASDKMAKLLEAIREYGVFFHSNSTYKKALAQEREKMQNQESTTTK